MNFIEDFIFGKGLKWIGRKLDGKKTKIAGVGAILYGIIGILGIMFPDQKLIDLSIEQSIASIIGGLGALGIGGKLEKVKNAVDEEKAVLLQGQTFGQKKR